MKQGIRFFINTLEYPFVTRTTPVVSERWLSAPDQQCWAQELGQLMFNSDGNTRTEVNDVDKNTVYSAHHMTWFVLSPWSHCVPLSAPSWREVAKEPFWGEQNAYSLICEDNLEFTMATHKAKQESLLTISDVSYSIFIKRLSKVGTLNPDNKQNALYSLPVTNP